MSKQGSRTPFTIEIPFRSSWHNSEASIKMANADLRRISHPESLYFEKGVKLEMTAMQNYFPERSVHEIYIHQTTGMTIIIRLFRFGVELH